jgi:hypothetical protein
MPSVPVTSSAYVPTREAVTRIALEQAKAARPKPEFFPADPVTRFKNILKEARTIAEQTGSPLPEGVHKIER